MFSWFLGWKRTRPDRTASLAGLASSSMRMNHCSEISGSIRSPERSQWPTSCSYGSLVAQQALGEERVAHLLARLRDRQAGELARELGHAAVEADRRQLGRPWRRPISKSFRSWPGVTLSAPVPKSIFTYSSAMIGTSRSTSGTIAVRADQVR